MPSHERDVTTEGQVWGRKGREKEGHVILEEGGGGFQLPCRGWSWRRVPMQDVHALFRPHLPPPRIRPLSCLCVSPPDALGLARG